MAVADRSSFCPGPPFVVTNARMAPRRLTRPPVLLTAATTPGGDRFWRAVDASLQARGSTLVSVVVQDAHSPCPNFGIAGSTLDASQLGARWPTSAPVDGGPLDDECVESALAWERRHWTAGEDRTDLTIRGLRAASWMMRHAVETLQPGLVLNWFGPVAVFAGFESALRQIDVPRLYVERGAIPMTYVVDPIGVLAPSVPTTDPAWRDMMAATPTAGEIACGRRIAALIGADRQENWKSARSFKDGADPRRTIAYFASNDLGYELRAPACWPAAGLPFGDSERALERLLAAVERVAPDARVVVKPHPFDPLKDRFARVARSTSVVVDESLSVHDAIDRGWTIATTSGSVGWIAIARGASALSLTTRSYTGCGAIHDPLDDASLDYAVRDGIRALISPDDPRRFAALARCGTRYAYSDDRRYIASGVQGPDALAARLIDALATAPVGPDGAAWIDALKTHGVAHQISDRTERTFSYMQAQVPHTEIASRILDALDPDRPLVVLGLGRNGRTLVEAAAAAGFSCAVFDDRPVDPATLPVGVSVASRLDAIEPSAQWVITPIDDASLLARIPRSVRPLRWSRVLLESDEPSITEAAA